MKSLVCINTYKSADLIKAFVWDYIDFVKNNPQYDFIVSLDGNDQETIEYCKKYKIPLLYSEKNEGVGISKNRVMQAFNNYDCYFFIEDDVELLDSNVFDIHIRLSKELDIHHFSLFEKQRIRNKINQTEYNQFHIIEAMYGSAQFNFFTKKGIEIVGGFHTHFAKYKRFGHTEHTYRFVHNKLSKYPFQIIEECLSGYFRWNDPLSRVKLSVEVSENRLFAEEENLILERIKFFPIQTLSTYNIINKNNILCTDKIIIDTNTNFNKQKFYTKLAFIDIIRKLKNILKLFIGK